MGAAHRDVATIEAQIDQIRMIVEVFEDWIEGANDVETSDCSESGEKAIEYKQALDTAQISALADLLGRQVAGLCLTCAAVAENTSGITEN
jgi:phosphate/sulfate permease